MAYYQVMQPSPGQIQQDVWQDHGNDGEEEEEYSSPGVRNLRQKFLTPRDARRAPRGLGSSRAPPPRPMTPPRDYDGTDVYDGSNRAGNPPSPPQPKISVKSTQRPRPQRQVSGGSRTQPTQPQARPQPQQTSPRATNYQSSIVVQPTVQPYGMTPQSPQRSPTQYNPGPPQQNYKPAKTLQSAADVEDTGECRVVHLQYNSPLQLYSTGNASETLEAQTKGAPGYGTLMVKGVPQEFDPNKSFVLQAIRDEEQQASRPVSTKQTIHLVQPSYGSDF